MKSGAFTNFIPHGVYVYVYLHVINPNPRARFYKREREKMQKKTETNYNVIVYSREKKRLFFNLKLYFVQKSRAAYKLSMHDTSLKILNLPLKFAISFEVKSRNYHSG